MPKSTMRRFFSSVEFNETLSDAFAKAVVKMASDTGYTVSEDEVKQFVAEANDALLQQSLTPRERPVPGDIQFSTMAMGEEDGGDMLDQNPSIRPLPDDGGGASTMAVGEEGDIGISPGLRERLEKLKKEREARKEGGAKDGDATPPGNPDKPEPICPTEAIGEDLHGRFPGRLTTLALGEEGNRLVPGVTQAIGEEDKPRDPPKLPITTQMVGEEDHTSRPGPTTAAVGEEGKRSHPPAHPITTKKVGEEDKRRPDITTARVGEEAEKPRLRSTMAMGEEEGNKPKSKKGPKR